MTTHHWGDNWPHWDELRRAQRRIHRTVRRLSGCHVFTKEKWGTLRYEYMFPPGTALWFPPGLKGKVKRWWSSSILVRFWGRWGWFITKRTILKILKERPYLAYELLEDAVVDGRLTFPKYLEVLIGWETIANGEKNEKT